MPDTFSVKPERDQQDVGEQVTRAFKDIELFAKRGPIRGE